MMKKTTYIIAAGILFFFQACKRDITTLNVDPKSPASVPAVTLFLNGEKNLFDTYTTPSVADAPFRVIAQEWTENTYVYEAQYNFSAYQAPDGWWNDLYGRAASVSGANKSISVINNLTAAKIAFRKDITSPATLKNSLIITDMLEIYAYYFLVATYGDIPYSQAENQTIPFPKYDAQKTVYADLLLRIDSCIKDIDITAGAMGAADQVYQGNPVAWKKFGATLKLKIAMLNADKDPATTSTRVQEALQAGIFQSDADDALLAYDPSSPTNSNPIWQAISYSGRHDFVPADILVDTMKSVRDPRLPLYFTPYPAPASGASPSQNTYSGGVPGAGNGYGLYSDFATPSASGLNGSALYNPSFPGDILDYSETEFLLAEAAARGIPVGGTAASFYNAAINASIAYWGGPASNPAYLSSPKVAYATAGPDWRHIIGLQEWISYYNRNWDSWTVIRRLGNPDVNTINPPVGAQGGFPIRFTYPTTEQTSNSVNWSAAVAALPGGKDVVTAKLFWML